MLAQGSSNSVKGEQEQEEELDHGMTAAAARAEFGLGLEQQRVPLLPHQVTLNEDSKKVAMPQPQQYSQVNPVYSTGAPFVSLATQDFLQPMERNAAAVLPASALNGDVPLQLSSRSRSDNSRDGDHLGTKESSCRFQNLRMQYGNFMENPHLAKSGPDAAANRHWHQQQQQQQQQQSSNPSKRPRSAQSEGDETDDGGDRRKTSRDDANSRSVDAKGNASRSKHSATEQRRRSKINDRFQMLRDLLPHGDQKRDKASFLLEVIEYIQSLQDKVKRFETVERGRQTKAMAWDGHTSTSLKETSGPLDGNKDRNSFLLAGTSPEGGKGRGYGPALQSSTHSSNHIHARTRHAQPLLSQIPSAGATCVEDVAQEDINNPVRSKASASQAESKLDDTSLRATTSREEGRLDIKEAVKNGQQKLPVKQGVISLSTAYSQGLLETLTSALQSSGLDLSKANISVQIELSESQTSAEQ